MFIDTGMSREGILVKDLPVFLKELNKLKNFNIVGLCSHFADADNPKGHKFVTRQVEEYMNALKILEVNGILPVWKHISASAGAFKIFDDIFDMVRVGLAYYGINPLEEKDEYKNKIVLQPVLEFVSIFGQVKKVPKGSFVGYNCTFTTIKDTF